MHDGRAAVDALTAVPTTAGLGGPQMIVSNSWRTVALALHMQAVNGAAGAFAACVDDVHRHADDPADKASVAQAARVRDSARQFPTEHRQDLARLIERPQP